MLLEDGDLFEGVHQGVDVGEAEGGGRGIQVPGEAQPAAGDRGGGAQVGLDNVVELAGADAIDFSDIEVAVGGAVGEGWEWEAWVVDRVVKEGGEMCMVGGGRNTCMHGQDTCCM